MIFAFVLRQKNLQTTYKQLHDVNNKESALRAKDDYKIVVKVLVYWVEFMSAE